MIIEFEYSGAGGHTITIQWYRDDGVIVEDGDHDGVIISGATTTQLQILNGNPEWSGDYYAIVTDVTSDCEIETDPVEVEFPDLCVLEITTQPEPQELFSEDTLTLTVAATGEVGSLLYQWYRDGVPLTDGPSGASFISGVNTDTLEITSISTDLAGEYSVIVTDDGLPDCTVTSNTVTVDVFGPPSSPFIWYKADAQSFNDGDTAFPIEDSSGNDIDLIRSSSSPPNVQPTFFTNRLNSLPVFQWESTNTVDTFGGPALPSFTGASFAIVFRREKQLGLDYSAPLIFGSSSSGNQFTCTAIPASGSDIDVSVVVTGLTSVLLTIQNEEWQIITFTFDFTEGIPRLKTNDDTAVGATAPGSPPMNLISLSCPELDSIAEVLGYNRKIDSDEEDQLRQYLSFKYDIPITV